MIVISGEKVHSLDACELGELLKQALVQQMRNLKPGTQHPDMDLIRSVVVIQVAGTGRHEVYL